MEDVDAMSIGVALKKLCFDGVVGVATDDVTLRQLGVDGVVNAALNNLGVAGVVGVVAFVVAVLTSLGEDGVDEAVKESMAELWKPNK